MLQFWNFAERFFFGGHVSDTIQNDIIDPSYFYHDYRKIVYGMLASLLSAGLWLQIASYFGWPVSTTHTIIGAVVGFGAIVGGFDAIYWSNVLWIVSSWVLSPLLGGILSYAIFNVLRKKIFYSPHPVQATKQLLPFIIFFVSFVLSLILIFNGLKNLNLHLNFIQSLACSMVFGLMIASLSYFAIRKIQVPTRLKPQANNRELLLSLTEVKKHLKEAKQLSRGDMEFQLSNVLENVDAIDAHITHPENQETIHEDFSKVEQIFAYLQIPGACLMAFAHGANDVANAIGPLSAAVEALKNQSISTQDTVPLWALTLGGVGIVIGLATWGWRVIETIGKKITELTPTRGFAAEFGAATTVLVASSLGLPISTTHTLLRALIGVGLARGLEALDMSMTRDIFISWLVTVPAGAIVSVIFFSIIQAIF